MTKGNNTFVQRLVLIIFILIGIVLVPVGVRQIIVARESAHWPSVPGKILSSGVQSHYSQKGGTTYRANVRYQYSINGESFTGRRVAFVDCSSGNSRASIIIVERYPVGKAVKVYYRPSDPKESLLEPGITSAVYFTLLFGAGFLFFGVLFTRVASKQKSGE